MSSDGSRASESQSTRFRYTSPSSGTVHLFQVRSVAADPIVFGARRELHVLAQQIFHTTVLIGRVVARRTAMAVQVGTDPAGRVDDTIKLHLDLAVDLRQPQALSEPVVFRTTAEIDLILAWVEWAMESAVHRVDAVFDKGPCAAETKVRMISIRRIDRCFDGNELP